MERYIVDGDARRYLRQRTLTQGERIERLGLCGRRYRSEKARGEYPVQLFLERQNAPHQARDQQKQCSRKA